jgi:fumigallin biosynthesis monooxygenase-like protein
MAQIIKQRMTARVDGEFVIFLIGMRINRYWKLHKWLPVATSMPRMLAELARKPESGFLGAQIYGGIPPVMAQYWRSFAHLEAYAKDASAEHFPAWRAFNRRVRSNGDVGIWHETYLVRPGQYETIYNNMPPYGLGRVGQLLPATGSFESSSERLAAGSSEKR